MTACHVNVDVDENAGNSQTNAMRQLMSNFLKIQKTKLYIQCTVGIVYSNEQ